MVKTRRRLTVCRHLTRHNQRGQYSSWAVPAFKNSSRNAKNTAALKTNTAESQTSKLLTNADIQLLKNVEIKEEIARLQQERSFHPDNSAKSQRARILQHLQNKGPITTLECRHRLDCMHPGMRICELRKAGHNIDMVRVNDLTAEGNVHRVAKYILLPKQQLSLFDWQKSGGAGL